ncbi:hydroxyethylthiazole kinase [uncultured Clostridium sp.]|uniref:hydroxyethylthiazole kinase n=1 Tax=uncultured Clostridium sp. TaxID=59620 RepID=UPI0028E579BE|nr:hydroxyethylthiazole kinase [uncultured Clostridium sp.]
MRNKILNNVGSLLEEVRIKKPLVHSITNYITATDCANVILAVGGSPTMADYVKEVGEIASISSAVVLNMGVINDDMLDVMIIAGKSANKNNIPVIFDPVGAGVANFRNETAAKILSEVKLDIIRGNISEIKFISGLSAETKGVDASESDMNMSNDEKVIVAQELAKKLNCTVAITGVDDVISDGQRNVILSNGHKMLANVTGTGCMSSALCGAFAGASEDYFIAAICAVLTMSISGEIAYEKARDIGIGTFHVSLIDAISMMNENIIKEKAKVITINN